MHGFVLLEMTEQKIYTTSSIPHTNDKQFVLKRTIEMGIYNFSAVGPIGVLACTVGDIIGPNRVDIQS